MLHQIRSITGRCFRAALVPACMPCNRWVLAGLDGGRVRRLKNVHIRRRDNAELLRAGPRLAALLARRCRLVPRLCACGGSGPRSLGSAGSVSAHKGRRNRDGAIARQSLQRTTGSHVCRRSHQGLLCLVRAPAAARSRPSGGACQYTCTASAARWHFALPRRPRGEVTSCCLVCRSGRLRRRSSCAMAFPSTALAAGR